MANFKKALDDALICKNTVGIEEIKASIFTITPNPIKGSSLSLNYNVKQNTASGLTIVNSMGQAVMEPRTALLVEGSNSLSLNNLNIKSGIYFLEIKQNNQLARLKFVVTE